MSDPGHTGSSDRKWDLSHPQTMLNIISILVTVAVSVFGVAVAVPWGQDTLCSSWGVGCPHFKVTDVRFNVTGIDFKGWCEKEYANASNEPPPGFINASDACSLDFSASDPPGFFTPVVETGIEASSNKVLVVHFQMNQPPQRVDTAFTLRTECLRRDSSVNQWRQLPCKLSPPSYGPEQAGLMLPMPTYTTDEQAPPPDGTNRAVIMKDKGSFIERWRLDIDGQTTAMLEPGDYRIDIVVGGAGEPIDDTPRGETYFTVFAPPSLPGAGTN